MYKISFGSLVTCFLAIIILTVYTHLILTKSQGSFKYHAKIIFIFSALVMIRTLLPINFPFTYSIYGMKIMNAIGKFVYFDLTRNLVVFDLFLSIWFIGAFVQIVRYIICRNKVSAFLRPYILSNEEIKQSEFGFLLNSLSQQKIQVACIPENIAPAIFGIIHPIIILSKDNFSSEDLHC